VDEPVSAHVVYRAWAHHVGADVAPALMTLVSHPAARLAPPVATVRSDLDVDRPGMDRFADQKLSTMFLISLYSRYPSTPISRPTSPQKPLGLYPPNGMSG